VKIVSGMDEESLEEIANIYQIVVKCGVHKAGSIKVAEAAKVVENSQRDINIAFMNELSMVFDRMNIDSKEVVDAMNTKWNALKFYPGLVGGHCIGVDPYYFIYEAERLGYHSQIILSGRKINDGMGAFIADTIIKKLVIANKVVSQSKVVILGITFKENCSDIRNSKVEDIISRLNEFQVNPIIVDPLADVNDTKDEYGVDLVSLSEVQDMDCVVIAVAHDAFKNFTLDQIDHMFKKLPNNEKVIIDVKSILNKKIFEKKGYSFWRL